MEPVAGSDQSAEHETGNSEGSVGLVRRLFGRNADPLPGPLRIGPVQLRTPQVVAVLVVLLVAVAGTVIWVGSHRPQPAEVPPRAVEAGGPSTPPASGTPSSGAPVAGATAPTATTPSSPAVLSIHVAGKVVSPGVFELPSGSRVADAIDAAGGPRSGVDLRTVNLARTLVDGEQVLVGFPPEDGAPGATPPAGTPGAPDDAGSEEDDAPIDLNAATPKELETLPGVGPVLAERIIELREEQGGFGSVDELDDVSGIGEHRFADLRGRVRVE